jgi:hypothetical protein
MLLAMSHSGAPESQNDNLERIHQVTSEIQDLLNTSSICRQVVMFLSKNRNVMDSVKGVASWWLHCDEAVAQAALDRLVECGVVAVRTLPSGPVYSLTRNPEIRRWLSNFSLDRAITPRAPAGKKATVFLADHSGDSTPEESISATPVGEWLTNSFDRHFQATHNF